MSDFNNNISFFTKVLIAEIFFVDTTSGVLNERALEVIDRVQQKLTGRDFKPDEQLTVPDQVQKLIEQATNVEYLAAAFIGWYVVLHLYYVISHVNDLPLLLFLGVLIGEKKRIELF